MAEIGPPFEKVCRRILGLRSFFVEDSVAETTVDGEEVHSLSTARTTSTAGIVALRCVA